MKYSTVIRILLLFKMSIRMQSGQKYVYTCKEIGMRFFWFMISKQFYSILIYSALFYSIPTIQSKDTIFKWISLIWYIFMLYLLKFPHRIWLALVALCAVLDECPEQSIGRVSLAFLTLCAWGVVSYVKLSLAAKSAIKQIARGSEGPQEATDLRVAHLKSVGSSQSSAVTANDSFFSFWFFGLRTFLFNCCTNDLIILADVPDGSRAKNCRRRQLCRMSIIYSRLTCQIESKCESCRRCESCVSDCKELAIAARGWLLLEADVYRPRERDLRLVSTAQVTHKLHTLHTVHTQYTHALFGVCKQIPTYPGQYNSSSSTRCPSVCVCVVIIVFVFSISHFPGNFGIFEILPTQPQAHTGHTQISRLTRLLSRI